MTEQTQHFVELSDILSFRLECPNCRCSVVFPLAKFQGTPRRCPNECGKEWEDPHTNAVAHALSELIQTIQTTQRVTLHKGLLFTLEIAKPTVLKEQEK